MRLPRVLALAVVVLIVSGGAAALTLRPAATRMPSVAARASSPAPDRSSPKPDQPQSSQPPAPGGSLSGLLTPQPVAAPIAIPALNLPISTNIDPVDPQPPPSSPGSGGTRSTTLPAPTSSSLPAVPALQSVLSPDAVLLAGSTITPAQLGRIGHLPGVAGLDAVDTGTVTMGRAPVVAFGVDPGGFRPFTPAASASSQELWRYLAGGALVSSYDMARDRGLKLGGEQVVVPAGGSGSVTGWMGAFASIGLPGVDLLVDRSFSPPLGLTPDSGVVISAPGVSGSTLRGELQSVVPGSAVELLHPDQLPQTLSGPTLQLSARQRIVQAALSRVGMPYVWGGAGPTTFDCSGLVQWSYGQAGVAMPRVAAEQFLTGAHIPLSAAQPGDLLFWTFDPADPGYVDHTAIYLGNGMMVEAPHTGLDVQVVPVPTQDFAGAVSVVLRLA